MREHQRLSEEERDQAVTDLIDLIAAVDDILQARSQADADYFFAIAEEHISESERRQVREALLRAYRWQ